MTKIRLILNLGVQSFFIILLLIMSLLNPEAWLYNTSLFLILISVWQITHAVYVVKKYKDRQYNQYLNIVNHLLMYALLILAIVGLMVGLTLGKLLPFWVFMTNALYFASGGLLIGLAAWYFWQSIQKLYAYYHRPRSFWDL